MHSTLALEITHPTVAQTNKHSCIARDTWMPSLENWGGCFVHCTCIYVIVLIYSSPLPLSPLILPFLSPLTPSPFTPLPSPPLPSHPLSPLPLSQLEPQLSHCVGFLEEVSREARGYCTPSVTVSLPVLGRHGQDGESVELSIPSAGRDVPVPEMLCQVHVYRSICRCSVRYIVHMYM